MYNTQIIDQEPLEFPHQFIFKFDEEREFDDFQDYKFNDDHFESKEKSPKYLKSIFSWVCICSIEETDLIS